MANTKFELLEDGVKITNFRRSETLLKMLNRYLPDVPDEKDVVITFGDASAILKKLTEKKSRLAPKLRKVVRSRKRIEKELADARPIVTYPTDMNGEPLTRGCLVEYRFPEQACLENDIFFARFIDMRSDGKALIRNNLFSLVMRHDGRYQIQSDKDSTLWPIDPAILRRRVETPSEIVAHYKAIEEDILRPVLPIDLETSNMKRKRAKKRRVSLSLGLTGAVPVE